MSLATAGIYCTTSLPLSRAMADSFIVQVQQLPILYRRRYSMYPRHNACSAMWNVVVAREHRRQDGGRWVGTMAKCQRATDERASQPWSRRSGEPVANVADGAPALYINVEYQSPDGRRHSEPTIRGTPVLLTCGRTQSCSSPGYGGPQVPTFLQSSSHHTTPTPQPHHTTFLTLHQYGIRDRLQQRAYSQSNVLSFELT